MKTNQQSSDATGVPGEEGAPPSRDLDAAEVSAVAFEKLREERATLKAEELVRIDTDIPSAVTIALGTYERIRPLRPTIVDQLPKHPMWAIDELSTYALAALHAHLSSLPPPDSEERVRRLLDEAGPLREKLLVAAEALAHAALFDPDRVAEIRAGFGNIDRGADLVALGSLFLQTWPQVENRTAIVRAEAERAASLGPQLLQALGAKDVAAQGASAAQKRDDRARAFTLLVRAYELCQQAVVYVRFHEDDQDTFAPTLRPKQRVDKGQPVVPPPPPAPPPSS
jgi:hypothetical protein